MQELKRLRNERGWSQQKLADVSGVNKVTINQIERGRRSPNVETLEKLADALGADVADFFPKAQAPLPFEAGPPEEVEERHTATKEEMAEAQRELAQFSAEATAYADRWEREAHERITEGAFPEWRYKEIVWAAVGIGRLLDEAIEQAGPSTPPATVARARDASVGMFDAVLRVGDIADAIEKKPVAREHLRVIQGEKPA